MKTQPKGGCLGVIVFCLIVWAVILYGGATAIGYFVESAVRVQLEVLNAQTYENQKTMLRIEAAQKELQSDMKTAESRLKALAAEQSWVREQAPSRSYTRNRTEIFTVTAYTLHPDECGKPVGSPGYGVTASGRKLTNADAFKVVAVDNSKIKFGTRMIIHSPKGPIYAVAADTGGAIQGNRLDLFVGETNRKAAFEWGSKRLSVTILD